MFVQIITVSSVCNRDANVASFLDSHKSSHLTEESNKAYFPYEHMYCFSVT